MAGSGAIYFVEVFFILVGLVSLLKTKRYRLMSFLLGWILIAPLPTTFLLETHFLRSAFMIPALAVLSATGLGSILSERWLNKFFRALILLIFLVQFVFILDNLYFLSGHKFSGFWSEPAKLVSERAINEHQNFDYVFISDRIDNVEFAYPVYAKVAPQEVQGQVISRTEINGLKFKQFDNVYIGSLPEVGAMDFLNSLSGRVLFLGSKWETSNIKDYEVIDSKDGLVAFIQKKFER
ncbi:MAG: hypothetical protein ACD_30C00071G0001 [uncultured bacterium]|nr:MAG: hypothetical protein ACD_30C00071G0001 [uncultured bacterium]